LFTVTSKTFTTGETLANAHAARAWLAQALGAGGALNAHFVAITGNDEAARAFGIAGADILPVWDWVGGRYSLWSAVGLPIAIRCGWDSFAELLAGAAGIDRHFRDTPLERNLPVLLALVDFWNARVLNFPQRIVAPYAEALKLLPSYLQQLTLESNGKSVLRDGSPVDGPTAPALWGGPGTDGQHAYFQWLHQGTSAAAVEFIVPVRAAHPLGEQQALLVANALAQAQALMRGKSLDEARAAKGAASAAAADALGARRVCPGHRPATTLLLPELGLLPATDPRFLKTLERIEEELRTGDLLFRYKHADDFGAPENAFTICAFWYVNALAAAGRVDEARERFTRLLERRNPLGLLSEDISPVTGELWGNFPQTYSMVGVIGSALRLSRSWEEIV
jgi:glucose-6-phosphate isomerase